MQNIFSALYGFLTRNFWLVIISFVIISVGFLYAISKLHFEEDITKVLPSDKTIQTSGELLKEAGLSNRIVISVLGNDTMDEYDLIAIADSIYSELEGIQTSFEIKIDYLKEEFSVIEAFNFYLDHLPYYMEETDYQYLDSILKDDQLSEIIRQNYSNIISPIGIGTREFILKDPLHLASRPLQRLRKWQLDDRYQLIENRVISLKPLNLVMFVEPLYESSRTDKNTALFNELDRISTQLKEQFSGSDILYFSGSRVAAANASRVKTDVYITVALALFMLLALIGTYFRNPISILKLFIPLALAGMSALTFLAFFNNNMSVIAIGVGSVLLGISIDFALHLFVHFQKTNDVRKSLAAISPSIVMSCITTAMAFICLIIIDSPAIYDLAIFAAVSIILSALYTLIFLPVFFKPIPKVSNRRHLIDVLATVQPEKSNILVWSLFILVLLSIPFAGSVEFQNDLMELNYMPDDLKETEQKINELSSFSQKSVYVFNKGTSSDETLLDYEKIRPKLDSLKRLDIVKKYTDHGLFVMSEVKLAERKSKWVEFWKNRKETVYDKVQKSGLEAGFNETAFKYFLHMVYKEYEGIDTDRLTQVFESIYSNYVIENDSNSALITMVKVDPESRDVLFNLNGIPESSYIVDQQYITNKFVNLLRGSFDLFVTISLSSVFLVLWLFYGRIELAVITFLPIISAWSLTLALMSVFGIQFNIFNVMLASFVFGLGIDYCIFMMRGLQHKYETGKDELPTFRASIYLSGFTTIIGTGVLIFARHPAIHSLAFIAIFGIGSVLILTNTLQPFLFNWLVYRKTGVQRERPVTLLILVNTSIVYGLFIFGSGLLMIVRLFLVFIPLPIKQKKYFFHVLIMLLNRIVLNSVFYIPRKILNKENIDYTKPSVIVANHHSFADILFCLNFNPKIMIQTKDWVWNLWVLRPIIRYADCYPVSFGIDQNIGLIESRMEEGYSMVIYPEGTRSETLEIKRFHSGAFSLSERIHKDIQPVLFQGIGHMMPKHEPFLYRDGANIKFLPRINYSDRTWGEDHRSRAKSISAHMRLEYQKMRDEFETASYFRLKLISKYIYKGPVLEWYMRVKLSLEKNYEFFNKQLPKTGLIYDVGCGYGFLSLMLKYTSNQRNVIGLDYDEAKIEIAKNADDTEKKAIFFYADACTFDYEEADAFVLNDILHYLDKDKQEFLLKRCLDKLKIGGIMIVRDADTSKGRKHFGTRLTEIISTGIGFNKKVNELEFVDEAFFIKTFNNYKVEIEKIDDTKYTSNQVFIIRKTSE